MRVVAALLFALFIAGWCSPAPGVLPLVHGADAADLSAHHAPSKLPCKPSVAHGLIGWRSSGGNWAAGDGMIVYDGQGIDTIVSPCIVTGDFAVQARIQDVRQTDNYNSYSHFGIMVRASGPGYLTPVGHGPQTGLTCGVFRRQDSMSMPNQTYAAIWDSGVYVDSPLDASNFTLDHAWHTYRVEVRFNRIKLLIDGNLYAQTTSNRFLSNRRVGLFSALHEINVRGFKVTHLR